MTLRELIAEHPEWIDVELVGCDSAGNERGDITFFPKDFDGVIECIWVSID